MAFLRLGRYTLNTDAIAYINWEDDSGSKKRVKVYLRVFSSEEIGPDYLSLDADSQEAQTLRLHLEG